MIRDLQDEYIKSSDIGILRLSFELRLIEKNTYSEIYVQLPRNGADFAEAFFGDENLQRLRALPSTVGSCAFLHFYGNEMARRALAVRITNGEIAVVFHTSFLMTEHFGVEYSSDALRVISKCIANLYEPEVFGLADVRQPTVFPTNTEFCDRTNEAVHAVRLSDSAAILKDVVKRIRPVRLLKLALEPSVMTRTRFVDIELLTYAMGELFASALLYSARTPIKISVGALGDTVVLTATGKYLISHDKTARPAVIDRANLRFVLIAGALAAIGITASAEVDGDNFSIRLTCPTELAVEDVLRSENTAKCLALAERVFGYILGTIGLTDAYTPIKIKLDD